MTSQGQRFRRRALRRGYKVDEVDTFLDRVEATLGGEQIGAPVGAQEVHDVVFRVRFGGYDEWQVDLHLDRVERQLAEFEERGGRVPESRLGPEPMRSMPVDRMGPSLGAMGRSAPPTERIPAPPMRDDRPMGVPQMPHRQQMPAPEPYGGRYEEPGYGAPEPAYGAPRGPVGYDTSGYDAFEPGRHGKADMTAEIRMPERDRGGYGPSPMSAPPMPNSPMSGPPMGGPAFGGDSSGFGASSGFGRPSGYGATPASAFGGTTDFDGGHEGGGGPNGELYRIDQLRRTFQPRRFGSGYDPMQVDRLFESILQAMSGRGQMPVPENELDTLQFGLVPGGYFEAEVDAALREVKDILLRRR